VLLLYYLFFNFNSVPICESIVYQGSWTDEYREIADKAVYIIGERLAENTYLDPCEAFGKVFGKITFIYGKENITGLCTAITAGACMEKRSEINFISFSVANTNKTQLMAEVEARNLVIHEIGHSFFWLLPIEVPKSLIDKDGFYIVESAGLTWRQHPCTEETEGNCYKEVLADMFLGWIFGVWSKDEHGEERSAYMDKIMPLCLYKRLYRKIYELPLAI